MAKSMRSKREKRLRAIRREIVVPIYEKKEAAKLAALEAALAAPKLPVSSSSASASAANASMDFSITTTSGYGASASNPLGLDVEMAEGSQGTRSLKPIGKKLKKKIKLRRKKHNGKGKIRRKRNV